MAKNNNSRMDTLEQKVADLSVAEVRNRVDDLAQTLEEYFKVKMEEFFREMRNSFGKENLTPHVNPVSGSNAEGKGDIGVSMSSPGCRNNENLSTNNHRMMEFEFPKFSGENPRLWLRKCHKYFLLNPMPDYEKMVMAVMHMEGAAVYWYMGNIDGRENMSWERFSEMVLSSFLNPDGANLIAKFNNLRQEGSVQDYICEFEELKSFMVSMNRTLTEDYFTKSFVSGLRDDIAQMVEMFNPDSLLLTMKLAKEQESLLNSMNRGSKMGVETYYSSVGGNWKTNSGEGVAYSKPKNYPSGSQKYLPLKKLTPEEMEARMKQNLCLNCDEPYDIAHKCKQLFFIIGTDSEEEEEQFQLNEGEETEGELQISSNASAGKFTTNTIKLRGTTGKHQITILVDSGSTHSFLDPAAAKRIGCVMEYTNPLMVTVVADGREIECNSIIPKFEWEMGGCKFSASVRLLKLGGYDMVIGVDLLRQLGTVTFDFENRKIQFQKQGKMITLQGT